MHSKSSEKVFNIGLCYSVKVETYVKFFPWIKVVKLYQNSFLRGNERQKEGTKVFKLD